MAKKESALRCVVVLTVIAVVCGVLLAVLNPLLYVAPTADDISSQFTLNVENQGEWELLELNQEFAGKTSDKAGAAVSLAAKMTAGEKANSETYYGLLVTTKASGNLSECKFVIFFKGSDDTIVDAKMSVDGSSGGKYSFEAAADKAAADKKPVRTFEDYYVKVESATQFDEGYTVPKVGATLTLTAVDNAFKKAVYYYYNVIMEGGKA